MAKPVPDLLTPYWTDVDDDLCLALYAPPEDFIGKILVILV